MLEDVSGHDPPEVGAAFLVALVVAPVNDPIDRAQPEGVELVGASAKILDVGPVETVDGRIAPEDRPQPLKAFQDFLPEVVPLRDPVQPNFKLEVAWILERGTRRRPGDISLVLPTEG